MGLNVGLGLNVNLGLDCHWPGLDLPNPTTTTMLHLCFPTNFFLPSDYHKPCDCLILSSR